jgi:hypothetical protein
MRKEIYQHDDGRLVFAEFPENVEVEVASTDIGTGETTIATKIEAEFTDAEFAQARQAPKDFEIVKKGNKYLLAKRKHGTMQKKPKNEGV